MTNTLIETGLNLMLIGWLLFMGFILGNMIVEYIEQKARKAAKREIQKEKEDGAK
jgi:hypothetical protein